MLRSKIKVYYSDLNNDFRYIIKIYLELYFGYLCERM